MAASRREFLAAMAVAGAGVITPSLSEVREALAHAASVQSGSTPVRFAALTPAEAAEVQAIAARIVPTTDTPGATEAGVVFFIDKAFETFAADGLPGFRVGLADVTARASARRAGVRTFAALSVADQDAVLVEMEQQPFFGWVRSLVMMGMFADPKYGGNRDEVGWKLIGFENAMTHTAPFGYYDAEFAKGRG